MKTSFEKEAEKRYFRYFYKKINRMKTILIPIDFSEGSMQSCYYAIKLCGAKPAKLMLFHIYPDQLMIPDSSFPVGVDSDSFLNTEFVAELRKQSELNMKKFIHNLEGFLTDKSLSNFKLSHSIVGGDPEWEIQEVIKEIKPEFIVMGTRGEGKKGFLEGSMSEKIMSKTSIPVFAVPNSDDPVSFKNVMYATNFSDQDFEKIKKLAGLFESFKTNFHIVHFNIKTGSESVNRKMEELKNALTKAFPTKKIVFHVFDAENKSDSLKTFIEQNEIDLISFIAHKNSIFKNLFSNKIHKKDFFKLELPMLAMHEQV